MKHTRALTAALAGATAAVVLAGCGNGGTNMPGMGAPPSGSASNNTAPAPHNDADTAFAQGMIPHHSQAIEMSRMAAERAQSEQVKTLARQIQAAQGPEIEMMTGWLNGWGKSPSAMPDMPGMNHGGGMNHGAMGGEGMMSPEEMQRFQRAAGPDLDRMFLVMMIKHHEGAIAMAQTELRDGQYPPAKELAQRIIDAQKAEIDTMRGMLKG